MNCGLRSGNSGHIGEPIQGEGGIRPADYDFLREIRSVADEFRFWCFLMRFNVVLGALGNCGPTNGLVLSRCRGYAKGLGGGFPVGAVLATAEAQKG